MRKQPKYVYGLYNKARTNDYKSSADKLKIIVSTQYTTVLSVWGIERSGFFNGREKWAKGFENQRV